jgi:hypothetical protein
MEIIPGGCGGRSSSSRRMKTALAPFESCIVLYCIYLHIPTHPYEAKAIGYRTSHTANLL